MIHTLAQIESLFSVPGLAAAGAGAATVPIAIHLLWRLRRRPMVWGAMRFLQAAYRRHRQRLRIEQLLLLLVRCLILIVLGLALAGPLLGGCAARYISGFDARGRTMHIVIDDALPSGAQERATGEARLAELKERALALVDGMHSDDRAALWRGSRPAGPIIAEPTQDREALRDAIEHMQPRASRPDVPAALRQVSASLEESNVPAGRAVVTVLSSFSEASTYLNEPAPSALEDLGERAELRALPPAPTATNVQIASAQPRRRMMLITSDSATVPVRVTLRRFERDLSAASVPLTVALMRADGTVLASEQREHRFAPGQRATTLNLSLGVPTSSLDLDSGAQMTVLEARVADGELDNQLAADDRRLALLELRSQLRVGMVDEPSAAPGGEGLRPAQWLTLVLDPNAETSRSGVTLQRVNPADVREQRLRALDAVMVLRPDMLSRDAWDRLARFAEGGGLVWIFTPPLDTPAVWTRDMRDAFDIDWRIGLEPVTSSDALGAPLESDIDAPDALSLLASDWPTLLGPVRVMRRLPVAAPSDETWLRVLDADAQANQANGDGDAPAADGDDARQPATVLLAHRTVGAGSLLLHTSALHTDWTNLPTKPLFVPLMHESLRGVLGSARGRIAPNVIAGDAPTLGSDWQRIGRLQRVSAFDFTTSVNQTGQTNGEADSIALRSADTGAEATRPIHTPGLYAADSQGGALKLAVNVDADAGDTRAVTEERVTAWLTALGGGELLDPENVGAILQRQAATIDIGWPLLWLVAALLVIETIMARYFSHARQHGQRGMGGQLLRAVRFLRHAPSQSPPSSAARQPERERERERAA